MLRHAWFANQYPISSATDGKFLKFDGTSARTASVTSEAFNFAGAPDSPFTISFWANTEALTANGDTMPVFVRGSGTSKSYEVYIYRDAGTGYKTLRIKLYSSDSSQLIDVKVNVEYKGFHNYVIAYSGNRLASGISFYVDGVVLSPTMDVTIVSDTLTALNNTPALVNYIGVSDTIFAKGSLKDLVVVNKQLSQLEAIEGYNSHEPFNYTSASFSSNIVSWYRFNDSVGDSIGGHHATSTNPDFQVLYNAKELWISATGNNSTATIGSSVAPFATLNGAFAALNTSDWRRAVINVGVGSFAGHTQFNEWANITIKGSGKPVINSLSDTTTYKLVGGTIFTSLMKFRQPNIKLQDFGVDTGPTSAGNGQDGLSLEGVGTWPTYGSYTFGDTIRNVSILTIPGANHALHLQKTINPYYENVTTYYGFHGIVYKSRGGLGVNIEAYGSTYDGVIIKSDIGTKDVGNVTINGFKYRDLNGYKPSAGAIYIESNYLNEAFEISNVLITGADIVTAGIPAKALNKPDHVVCTDLLGLEILRVEQSGPVHYWTLNEASGNRNDSIGDFHLTDTNANVGSIAGKYSNAATFSAIAGQHLKNQKAGIASSFFTLNFWAYVTNSSGTFPLIARNSTNHTEYSVYVTSGNLASFLSTNGTTVNFLNGTGITLNTWFMATFRVDETGAFLYLNGVKTSSTPLSFTGQIHLSELNDFVIGSKNTPGNCRIDDVKIWHKALTDAEITALVTA